MQDVIKNITKARKAIIADSEGKRSTSGRITPCPVCGKGTLAYGIAYNGHVSAACEAGCVKWVE
jgi:hypothetical protein